MKIQLETTKPHQQLTSTGTSHNTETITTGIPIDQMQLSMRDTILQLQINAASQQKNQDRNQANQVVAVVSFNQHMNRISEQLQ